MSGELPPGPDDPGLVGGARLPVDAVEHLDQVPLAVVPHPDAAFPRGAGTAPACRPGAVRRLSRPGGWSPRRRWSPRRAGPPPAPGGCRGCRRGPRTACRDCRTDRAAYQPLWPAYACLRMLRRNGPTSRGRRWPAPRGAASGRRPEERWSARTARGYVRPGPVARRRQHHTPRAGAAACLDVCAAFSASEAAVLRAAHIAHPEPSTSQLPEVGATSMIRAPIRRSHSPNRVGSLPSPASLALIHRYCHDSMQVSACLQGRRLRIPAHYPGGDNVRVAGPGPGCPGCPALQPSARRPTQHLRTRRDRARGPRPPQRTANSKASPMAGCSAMPPTTPSPSPLGRSSAPGC